jgi:hypothetical protein
MKDEILAIIQMFDQSIDIKIMIIGRATEALKFLILTFGCNRSAIKEASYEYKRILKYEAWALMY